MRNERLTRDEAELLALYRIIRPDVKTLALAGVRGIAGVFNVFKKTDRRQNGGLLQ